MILFDEIEKAHHDVFHVLLQLLDDGRITDSQGHTVDFKNTVVILTSNIGSTTLIEDITPDGSIRPDTEAKVKGLLHEHFRPEFLNRIDDVVLFSPLLFEEIKQIVDLLIAELGRRLAEQGLTVEITDGARELIAREGYDPVYGARPLKRYLQRTLETRIGRALLSGDFSPGSKITVDLEDGELAVSFAAEAESTAA